MLTRKRIPNINLSGDWGKDGERVIKWVSDYLLSLEQKGSLSIDANEVTNSIVNSTVHVGFFGAVGNGVRDDTEAFQAAAAEIVRRGGGTIVLEAGATYKVWDGVTGTLFALNGANGVRIEGNGATIDSAQTNPTLGDCKVFDINGVDGFSVDNLTFLGGNTTLTFSTGEKFILGYNGTHNVKVTNCAIKNCESAFQTDSSASSVSRGWKIENVYCEGVYYPITCYWLDDLKAKIVTRNCGRSYFPVNPCNNHDVDIDSQMGSDFSDCLLKVYARSTYTAVENTLSNIRLNYKSSGKYSGTGDQDNEEACVAFDLQQFNTNSAAGHLRNIRINLDVECNATDQFANLVIFRKYKSDGTGDNVTTRGHSIRDVTVSGTATNWDSATQNGVRLFSVTSFTTAQDWTGDTIENIALKNLRIEGAPPTDSIYVNQQGFSNSTQSLVLDNVNVDGTATFANTTNGRIGKRAFIASNDNSSDCEGSWTPGISFGGGTTGITYTTQTGSYTKRGNRVTCTGYVLLSSKGSSTGAAKLTGLPFTARNNNDSNCPASVYLVGVTFTGQHQHIVDLNATTVSLNQVATTGTASNLTDANFSNTSSVYIQITYRVA